MKDQLNPISLSNTDNKLSEADNNPSIDTKKSAKGSNKYIYNMFYNTQLEFGVIKTVAIPSPSYKHDVISDFKFQFGEFRDFKASKSKVCLIFGTSDAVHQVVKNWKSTKPDPTAYEDFVLFANQATKNKLGVERFCLTINALVEDYKKDPEGTENKYKGTTNRELKYHHCMCEYFKKNPNVLKFKLSSYLVRKILRKHGIYYAKSNRSRLMRDKNSASEKALRAATKNILARQFKPEYCNFTWVSDITEIEYKPGNKAYICAVRDLNCGSILGWSIDTNMKEKLAVNALENAIAKAGAVPLLLHTDGGKQFTGNTYSKFCELRSIKRSVSRPGKCHDNAKMETFFANLKTEMSKETDSKGKELKFFTSLDNLELNISDYIDYYNTERISIADKTNKLAVRARNLSQFKDNNTVSSISHIDLADLYIKSLERNTNISRIIEESNKGMTEEDHDRIIRSYAGLS